MARGKLQPVARAFVAKSGSVRRGPSVPKGQPKRMGKAMRMFNMVGGMVKRVIKGPDRGMG
jgi:hypothetical protein